METNPFTPTFGIVPPYLAGRKQLLADMSKAFASGLGNPNLSTILIGARGTGKTALLSCIESEAQEQGWISVNVSASDGMLEDVIQQAGAAAAHLVEPAPKTRITALNIGQILGIEWAFNPETQANWRSRMNALFEELAQHETGLLITVDEVDARIDEMVQLAATYQLFIREGKQVALVMAGLPAKVTDLVNDSRVTFLRRARQQHLGRINDIEVERALRKTISSSGKDISEEALQAATEATNGFAYMLQLVGYCMWEEAEEASIIDIDHAKRGIRQAHREFERGVLQATYLELSAGDRSFLFAMLDDSHGSILTDVAARMGKSASYASNYKRRLTELGIIGDRGGKTFDFDIPFMREYLQARRSEE